MRKIIIPKRLYIYVAGAVIIIAVIIGAVILTRTKDTKPNSTAQTTNPTADDQFKPIKSESIQTPTKGSELADTLTNDASGIENDLRNYENDDYNDTNLNDNSLYN